MGRARRGKESYRVEGEKEGKRRRDREGGSGKVNGGETKVRGGSVEGDRGMWGRRRQFCVHYTFTCVNYFLFKRASRKAKDNFSAHNFCFMK